MPCIVLRTSRFFLELDDNPAVRGQFEDLNIKANELLFRRADIEDIVEAHFLAIEKASSIGYDRYIISATPPFSTADLVRLNQDAPSVIANKFPRFREIYQSYNWRMFPTIPRVYVNEKARKELGWLPKYDFQHVLDCLSTGKDFRSPLALSIGIKGYHDQEFKEGPYPV